MDSFFEQWIIDPHIPDSAASYVALFAEGWFISLAVGDAHRKKVASTLASIAVAAGFAVFNKFI